MGLAISAIDKGRLKQIGVDANFAVKNDRKLCQILKYNVQKSIIHAAEKSSDNKFLVQIRDEDHFAKEALYHKNCMSSYTSKSNLKTFHQDAEKTNHHPWTAFTVLVEKLMKT